MLEALGEASLLVEIDQALRNRLQQMRAEAGIVPAYDVVRKSEDRSMSA